MTSTDVLGVRVSAVDPIMALDVISRAVQAGSGGYVCVTGVHGVMESQADPQLLTIHNEALLTVPDGMPLVWLSRRAGSPWVRRVYGPDLMLTVLAEAASRGWSSYFYGGGPGVAQNLQLALTRSIPGLLVAGTHTPPFRPLNEEEDAAVVADILAAKPQFVWVGLSTPKQERWMAAHAEALAGVVLLGVGAAFDFHTGNVRQAPGWIQRIGMEWFFRLAVEPRRLWRRYLGNNPRFLWSILHRPPRRLTE